MPVTAAREVKNGTAIATVDGKPVGVVVRHGAGLVAAIGFGSRFNDESMGITTDIEPSEDLRRVFDVQFWLVRGLVEGTLTGEAE